MTALAAREVDLEMYSCVWWIVLYIGMAGPILAGCIASTVQCVEDRHVDGGRRWSHHWAFVGWTIVFGVIYALVVAGVVALLGWLGVHEIAVSLAGLYLAIGLGMHVPLWADDEQIYRRRRREVGDLTQVGS